MRLISIYYIRRANRVIFLTLLVQWGCFQIQDGLIASEWAWRFFEVVGCANFGKLTGSLLCPVRGIPGNRYFDFTKHRLDDDFALLVNRLCSGRLPHRGSCLAARSTAYGW